MRNALQPLLVPALVFMTGAGLQDPHVDLGPELRQYRSARDQGARNTCSLFAVTAMAEFEFNRSNPGAPVLFSEEFLTWAANRSTGLQGDQAMFFEAVHGLNTLGICAAELMPYQSRQREEPSVEALANAKQRAGCWNAAWIRRWDTTHPLGQEALAQIKAALASGHPVACGLRWPKQMKGSTIRSVPQERDVYDGHSILITGYRDTAGSPGGGVFYFLNSAGPGWGRRGFGKMSYAYLQAYANDAVYLEYVGTEQAPDYRFEGEQLSVLAATNCPSGPQQMSAFGGGMWSGGAQLLCRSEGKGSITVVLPALSAGRYRLELLATAAPDFGQIRVELDGKELTPAIDLYSGRVSPTGPIGLGMHDFAKGDHELTFVASRSHPSSTGHYFGIDAIELYREN